MMVNSCQSVTLREDSETFRTKALGAEVIESCGYLGHGYKGNKAERGREKEKVNCLIKTIPTQDELARTMSSIAHRFTQTPATSALHQSSQGESNAPAPLALFRTPQEQEHYHMKQRKLDSKELNDLLQ
ncbi:hypothetical protein Bpfe_008261 [Biomphalaria pfeifferi]|uniref:Uncharacterized protein n=1 Tax=Biomphalaria pfeifferi TaxID=112525 RepID=A0AAD8BYI8_BIOPF|nr:hypothetical protein Bpfe_008261 [Biomphalaria pfeifferi]